MIHGAMSGYGLRVRGKVAYIASSVHLDCAAAHESPNLCFLLPRARLRCRLSPAFAPVACAVVDCVVRRS
jgi:hypothetical protein